MAALFGYADREPGQQFPGIRLKAPYAAVAIRTNGFAPPRDRIVEIAVVTFGAGGTIEAEPVESQPFVTLLAPPTGEPGPAFLHGLEAADLRFAPSFADIAPDLLTALEGRIVVAHNGRLVEQFLAAEFLTAGFVMPTLPAIDLSSLSRLTVAAANCRLLTLAAELTLPVVRGGAALDEALLVSAILPRLLERLETEPAYPVPLSALPMRSGPVPPRPPARPGQGATPAPRSRPAVADSLEPWLSALMTELPMSAAEVHDPRVAAYLEALTDVVSRGRTAVPEAAELAHLLARSGYSASQIRAILQRLLESLREAAFAQGRMTASRLRHLRAVAVSVGLPSYFDDLIPPPAPTAPEPGSGTFSRPVRKPVRPPPPPHLPRCGHCLGIGHWTANCPGLRRRSIGGAIGPVRPIDPIL